MDIIKTMGDFKIPQFTLLTSPEQDEIVRQREAEAEREREVARSMQQAKENSILNYVLRHRYENMLPTVLISNLKKEDLLKNWGMQLWTV